MKQFTNSMKFIGKGSALVLSLLLINAVSFGQDLERYYAKEKYGYYDKASKLGQLKPIIKAQYEDGKEFNSTTGLAAVKSGGKWGMIDKTGAQVLPFEYDFVDEKNIGDLTIVSKGGKKGFTDKTGKIVLPLEYDNIINFSRENTRVVVAKDKKYGFMNTTTYVVSPLNYEQINICIEGWLLKKNGKWALADINLKELTPYKYDVMSQGTATHHYAEYDGNKYKISLKGVEEYTGKVSSGSTETKTSTGTKTTNDKCTYKCKACNEVAQHSCTTKPGTYCDVLTQKAASAGGGRKAHEWVKQ